MRMHVLLLLLIGSVVGFSAVIFLYNNVLKEDWGDKFHSPVKKEFTISAFSIHQSHLKKGVNFTFKKQEDLDLMYQAFRNPNVPFGTLNAKSCVYSLDYSCTFSDGSTLKYAASLHIFKDRTYLLIYYPEDAGFQGDPTIDIQLEGTLSEDVLKDLRNKFLKGVEPPIFKPTK